MHYLFFTILLFTHSSSAQDVKYAFQSVQDKDRLSFVKENEQNRTVLYISDKCTTCLASLERVKEALIQRQVSVVVSTNNLNYLRNLVKKNASNMSGFVYYDPGRRLESDLNLKGIRFSYIVFSGGKFRKFDRNGSVITPPPKIYN